MRLVVILVQVRKNYIEYGILPSRLFNNLFETKMFLEWIDAKPIKIMSAQLAYRDSASERVEKSLRRRFGRKLACVQHVAGVKGGGGGRGGGVGG